MTAIVTGAAGGLGAAFARAFAAQRKRLLLVDVRSQPLHDLADTLASDGVEVEPLVADLTVRDDIERVARVIEMCRDREVIVNNAGFGQRGLLAEAPPEGQLAQIDIMISATVRFCRAALPALVARRSGAVINVSSVGAFNPGTEWGIYGAAKRFILHYTRSLAKELRGTGVRAQALCPGWTHTGFHDASGSPESKHIVPDAMWMTPDEVARASLDALATGRCIVIPGLRHHLHLAATYSATFRRVLYGSLRRLEGSRSWL
jgi:short-subunit dehydrogenase